MVLACARGILISYLDPSVVYSNLCGSKETYTASINMLSFINDTCVEIKKKDNIYKVVLIIVIEVMPLYVLFLWVKLRCFL